MKLLRLQTATKGVPPNEFLLNADRILIINDNDGNGGSEIILDGSFAISVIETKEEILALIKAAQ